MGVAGPGLFETEPGADRAAAPAWTRRDVAFPLGAFAVSRLVQLVGAYLGAVLVDGDGVLDRLLIWDGAWYDSIVHYGYPSDPGAGASSVGFFPAYPFLAKVVDAFGPTPEQALVIVAMASGAVACVLIHRLFVQLGDRATADLALLLFVFFPGSAVLGMAYAESLFLAASAGALLLARRSAWVAAGAVGALATATRPNGLAVVVALAIAALVARRASGSIRPFVAPVLAMAGTGAFLLGLWIHTGEAGVYWRVQREGWDTAFKPAFLFETLSWGPGAFRVDNLHELTTSIAVVTGLVLTALMLYRRPPPPELAFALVVLAMAAFTSPVGLRARFLMTAFPVFWSLARTLPRDGAWLTVGLFAGCLGSYAYLLTGLAGVVP